MFAQWHKMLRKDVKSLCVLEFNAFFWSLMVSQTTTIMVFLLFSELKRNKSQNAEIVYVLVIAFSVLAKVSLFFPHAHLFCCSSQSPLALLFEWTLLGTKASLFGVFLHYGITQAALILSPVCYEHIYIFFLHAV